MGANAGPDIVSDGLVLALDAADNNSFRGEPTTNKAGGVHLGFNGGRWGKVTTYPQKGSLPFEVQGDVYRLLSGNNYWGTASSFSPTYNKTYTLSYWYYLSTDTNLSSWHNSFFGVPQGGGSQYSTVSTKSNDTFSTTGTNTWRFGSVNISTNISVDSYTYFRGTYTQGSADSMPTGDIYIANFQLEEKTSATRFTTGTRGTTVATGGGWADISGNDNHGEILNGTSTSNDGSVLGALDFDGADDRVTIPAFTYTPYCIDFWLYNNSLVPNTNGSIGGPSTYQTLISFGGGTAGVNLGGWTSGATNEALHIWSTSGGNRLTYTRDESIPVGYHNWIFNWNGSQYDIWVDGEKLNTYAGGGGHASLITYTNQPLYLGTNANTYEFYGKIFKFKMYETQLSDNQILQNFNAHRAKFGL